MNLLKLSRLAWGNALLVKISERALLRMSVKVFVICVKCAKKIDRGMFYDPKSLICMKYRQVEKYSTAIGKLLSTSKKPLTSVDENWKEGAKSVETES